MSDVSDGGRSAGGVSAATSGAALAVVPDAGIVCKFCRAQSDDPTPLVPEGGGRGQQRHQYRPWLKYVRRVQPDGMEARVPVGQTCLICVNTYRALGLQSEHKSMNAYYKFCMSQPSAGHLHRFAGSVKEWIRQHNTHPGRATLKDKTALRAQTTLEVQNRVGARLKKPKQEPLSCALRRVRCAVFQGCVSGVGISRSLRGGAGGPRARLGDPGCNADGSCPAGVCVAEELGLREVR